MVAHTDVKVHSRNSSYSTLRPCQPTLPPKFLLAATPRVCVCEQQLDQIAFSCKTWVCLYEQFSCLQATFQEAVERKWEHCCLCRLSTARSSYLWNMHVTVCIVGMWAHSNMASEKEFLFRLLTSCCFPWKHKTCWFSETSLHAGGFPSTVYSRSPGGILVSFLW